MGPTMVDPVIARIWFYRMLFVVLTTGLLLLCLPPLQFTAPRWAGPAIVLCVTLSWALRRPSYVPALLIALVFFPGDLLLHPPPGLMAAIVVLAGEFLRDRAPFMRDAPFSTEWLLVGAVMLLVVLAYRTGLVLAIAEPPPFWLSLTQLVSTVLAYPVVVWVSRFAFGVGRASPHEGGNREAPA